MEAFGYISANPYAMLGSRPLLAAPLKAQSWPKKLYYATSMPRNRCSFDPRCFLVPLRLYVELLEAFGYKNANPTAMLGSRPLPAALLEAQSLP